MRIIKLLLICSVLGFAVPLKAQNLDLRVLNSINGPDNRADGFWRGVSNSDQIVILATPAAMLTTGFATKDPALKIKAIETGGAIFLAEGSTFLLKRLIKRDRPFIAHPDLINAKVSESSHSFPSGHTSSAFATATSLSLAFPKWYVIAPSFAYAGTVGYSRMYLGAHYPSDVLAGALVGAGSAFLTFKLQSWLSKKVH